MVEFRNVSKVYSNGTEALHNINLTIDKGEFVFIVGSSGAGKSTFLKLIMCEERPNEGQIIIDSTDISRLRKRKVPYMRRKMGIVFQDFRLIDHMTVYDNVAFAMRVVGASGRAIKKRVPYILSLVGLQHKAKHKPNELSGGERQRIGLARALVNNPTLIIADEPTGNIDPALSFEIVDLLSEINRRGTTILMVTHEHSLVKHFQKRIIQIHSGEIVADTAASVNNQNISRQEAQMAYEREENLSKEVRREVSQKSTQTQRVKEQPERQATKTNESNDVKTENIQRSLVSDYEDPTDSIDYMSVNVFEDEWITGIIESGNTDDSTTQNETNASLTTKSEVSSEGIVIEEFNDYEEEEEGTT